MKTFALILSLASLASAQTIDYVRQIKNKPVFDVRQYGAKGDGTTNDVAAIQAAIDAAPAGATVLVPNTSSYYLLSGSGSYLLNIPRAINFVCMGPMKVAAATPTTTDVFYVRGSAPIDGGGIQGCDVRAVSGTPGRYGIHLDATSVTNGANYIARFMISGNYIAANSSYAIKLTFPTQNDGFFNSWITHNKMLQHGIDCNRCGDTVEISHNTIGGKYGVIVRQVYGAGQLLIRHNSIVSCAPAIHVVQGSGVRIESNNIEPLITADASCTLQDGAVYIEGSAAGTWTTVLNGVTTNYDGAAVGNTIIGNTFVNIPLTNKYGLKVGQYAKGTYVAANRFGLGGTWDGSNPQKAIQVVSGATDTVHIGNYLDYVTDWSLYLVDAGTNTYGTTSRGGVTYVDGALTFRPDGATDTWKMTGRFLDDTTGTLFGSLGSATGVARIVWCGDCNIASPCTGGGTGAWAFSNGSVWKCPF